MPFAFLAAGILLVIVGVRDKQNELFSLLKDDFGGSGSFTQSYIAWLVAILLIGSLGYIKPFRTISNAFLVLVILVLFISNRGFFARFNQALGLPTKG